MMDGIASQAVPSFTVKCDEPGCSEKVWMRLSRFGIDGESRGWIIRWSTGAAYCPKHNTKDRR